MSSIEVKPGSLVHGRYRLVERVGGGGMGHVFRAEDVQTARTVAVKLLHRELWSSPDVTARLFQEAKVVSSIRHPNIVEILDADTSEHGPFIAMEFLEGSSAGALLQALGRFDEATTLAIVIPVLDALHSAHEAGVVHRDLKPENVFVCHERTGRGERGSVHLLDFGIAKLSSSQEQAPRTRTGVVFGTPDYLSPEQATGEGQLDGRSDLFSVGIVMFELLTGRRPFAASTAVATAFRIVHAAPPSFESLGVSVTGELRGIIRKLLAKAPADRPASAGEVLRVLTSIDPDEDARQVRLLRILGEADDRRRRSTRPPPTPRQLTPSPLGLDFRATLHRSAREPSMRSLGRSARGAVLFGIDGALERTRGELERERIVALLPDTHAEELRRGRPSPLEAHDIEVVRRYVDVASKVLRIDAAGFFALGQSAVDHELVPFVGTLVQSAEFADVLRRSTTLLRAFFEFGAWSVSSQTPRRATVSIEGFDLVPPLVRSWYLGVFQRVFASAVSPAVEVIDVTPASRLPSLFAFEISAAR